MTAPLHIVEPTLEDSTGHCYSYLDSLCRAAGDYPITVWGGRAAQVAFPGNVRLERFFRRRLRRLQAWGLYRRLLREPGRIFVSTAGRSDLILLDLAARGAIPPGKAYLYVHWFRAAPAKQRQLARLARRQPAIEIFAPTETVCAPFRAAGFARATVVPYPITPAAEAGAAEAAPAFRHVLFAGAARSDKGFGAVVDFVELLAKTRGDIPVTLQTSAQHYDKVDAATAASLARLEGLRYPLLTRHTQSLSAADYGALFAGAICLQLYSRSDFADRVSGVTLDALSRGSPIVTLSGTWMARVVEEFGAGLALQEPAPAAVLEAVARLKDGYAHYHRRAWKAGRELQKRNNAGALFRALTA